MNPLDTMDLILGNIIRDLFSNSNAGCPNPALAGIIDHTLLKPEATPEHIAQLCYEAHKFGFATVCVNPIWVGLCAQLLKESTVRVCTVAGFPLGASAIEVKAFECRRALESGAKEIDVVLQIGALKAGDLDLAARDITQITGEAHSRFATVKLIVETALLTDEEKTTACVLAKNAGVDFVKTSTGFASGGATVEDIVLMRAAVGPGMGIKAAGGIRSYSDAERMIRAGATRIGTSAGKKIIRESLSNAAAIDDFDWEMNLKQDIRAAVTARLGVDPEPHALDASVLNILRSASRKRGGPGAM